jgi:hypothetical protein
MSTELSVETDYINISRTHTTNLRARYSLYDPTVEYARELSDSSVQFRHSSVGIRQLAFGIRLKQSQRIRTETGSVSIRTETESVSIRTETESVNIRTETE